MKKALETSLGVFVIILAFMASIFGPIAMGIWIGGFPGFALGATFAIALPCALWAFLDNLE